MDQIFIRASDIYGEEPPPEIAEDVKPITLLVADQRDALIQAGWTEDEADLAMGRVIWEATEASDSLYRQGEDEESCKAFYKAAIDRDVAYYRTRFWQGRGISITHMRTIQMQYGKDRVIFDTDDDGKITALVLDRL
ncbi:MAG: hypothetical protein LBR80_01735 [Deltaproteobacteria bacterium]|jgi:hypothetical protein|nr:hypothetical protein [Deltaproteobacteria bacterium]